MSQTTSEKEVPSLVPTEKLEALRWLLLGLMLATLFFGFYIVFRPFVGPVSWATIVVLGAWPLHLQIHRRMPNWPGLSATLSSLFMALVVVAILYPLLSGLGPELKSATLNVGRYLSENQGQVIEQARQIPNVGESIAAGIEQLGQETVDFIPLINQYSQTLLGTATLAAQGLAWGGFNLGFFCLSVFFLFYYGETLSGQLRTALLRMDPGVGKLADLVQRTVTGVLYGLVMTAIAQGLLAGLGFAVAGAKAPILLGLATTFLSFFPYGPQLVYLPVSLFFILDGFVVRGVLLGLWGLLVVSSADNLLKPYFIARQMQLPLPLVLVGVTGGLLGFGLIGVFVGPVVVGLVQTLWLAWTEPEEILEEVEEAAPIAEPPEQPLEDEVEEPTPEEVQEACVDDSSANDVGP